MKSANTMAAVAPAPGTGGRKGMSARAVGSFVPKLTRKAFEKYGFSAATLITDWALIVGPEIAAWTAPERLKWARGVNAHSEVESGAEGRPGATLILRVDGGRALDIEYKRRQIVERINAYFGYRAVAEMKVLQAPIDRPKPREVLSRTRAAPAKPSPEVARIEDPALRDALARMQSAIARRSA